MKHFLFLFIFFLSSRLFASTVFFPSNLNKATHFAMTLTDLNEESVIQTYLTVYKVNAERPMGDKIEFLLLSPEAFQPLNDLSELGAVSQKVASIESTIKEKISSSTIPSWTVIQSEFLQYSWLQDTGQPFWVDKNSSGNFSRAFIDVNRPLDNSHPTSRWPVLLEEIVDSNLPFENSDFSLMALKNHFSWDNYRMPNITVPYDPNFMGNQGGNIEAMPGGDLYIGNTAPEQLLDFISGITGKTPLVIDTSFLVVGHVDEIQTIIPAENSCGFALVLADPLEGAVISAKLNVGDEWSINGEDSLSKSLSYFKNGDGAPSTEPTDYDISKPLRLYKEGWEEGYPYLSDWVVYKSIQAKTIIEDNGRQMISSLKKHCPAFDSDMVARVPVSAAFSTEVDFFQADPDPQGKGFIHFSTPTTNLVVLDDHLVMADFTNSPIQVGVEYKNLTISRLKNIGYKEEQLHFVDASAYHVGMGSIHCGTLTLRSHK